MKPPLLEPYKQPLRAYAGASFAVLVRLWKNEAHTEPYLLAGYTLKLNIEGVKVLEEGKGLTIEGENGVLIELTPAETAAAANGANISPKYVLSLEKEGEVTYAMRGTFSIEVI